MTRTGAPWREPTASDRCTASVAAVARDLFTWHRRGITVRMVEPTGDGGVLLGVDACAGHKHNLAIHRHAAGADQLLEVAPRGNAGTRQHLL